MEQIMINNNNKHHKNNMILSRMHKDSQTILSKNKPQGRIIHIFAPEIIKTDPANFMELVQRLTGKPTNSSASDRKKKKNKSGRNYVRSEGDHIEVVKREEAAAAEIWRSSAGSGNHESAGGFLDGFGDMDDGFMHQLGPDLLPHNHNPVIMHQHQHHQQQQQYHFFVDEQQDHNSLNRVHGGNLLK